MRVLALETSTEYCSVALWQDGRVSGCCELAGQRHSEILMDMLNGVLTDAGITLQQLDGLAFGRGPGSFTGVRIACGVAQGLALGADLPVAGICTLAALAEASAQDKVIAVLDARMGELYHAAYEKQRGDWVEVSAPRVCKPADVPAVPGGGWHLLGSGVRVDAALPNRYNGQLAGIDGSVVPQASAVARLGAHEIRRGAGLDAAQALPLYLRDKVALTTAERQCAK
ncbi:MAG: tRNA (adenosine(37)-N6)-threonylcarbamoyltransferase complex dimerization subunit type 1 TsaB [Gallionella sp.]|jgi:tRNA threonylcarbamoyladenosine biosynthesis protein TsaB|nr:tRNA (adenosine(37)-N6)-threonylcarbamoyltransferase complex dimerization subunit type 1 TsaB [Gallionella sp.]